MHTLHFVALVGTLACLFVLSQAQSSSSSSSCTPEFEQCSMSRDCCDDLTCVTGDWAVTTDSTCLSERSVALDAMSTADRVAMIYNFYHQTVHDIPDEKRKTRNEVQALVDKHARSFAKLVARIEKLYDRPIIVSNKDEL